MNPHEIDLHKELKKYFGFNQFKGLQEQVVKSIITGNNTFVIMPTGGGKSLCYQLPALVLEGTAIVVSPLIALMKNQVDAIRSLSSEQGIAHVLNSSLNKTEIAKVKKDITSGITKLLYVAPESLTKEEYIEFLNSVKISFVAIDEAHCISEWGHDFRPEYRNLRNIVRLLGDVPMIGLTATATPKVQEDILKNLDMPDANTFKASFNRPNLYYEVRTKTKNIESDIIRFIKQHKGKSGVIYCLSRKKVEEIAQVLQVNGISAVPYHAGLDAKTRAKHQDMFLMEDVEVVVATIAFNKVVSEEIAKNVSMQIAAMAPVSISKDDCSAEIIEKELEIARDITRQEGKPEEMVEKIAQGKLNKFFKESTLLSQDFIKDSKKTVQQYLQEQDKELTVVAFKRFSMS